MKEFWRIAKLVLVLVLFLGLAYPLVMALAARVTPNRADGSVVYFRGKPVGAELIGQEFTSDSFFHGRPSAAGNGYDAMKSGASNLGPTNPRLITELKTRIRALIKENPGIRVSEIPVDLITGSGSGLDPDISVDAAMLQVKRVSAATGISVQTLSRLVRLHTGGRFLGIFGEPRVNVLELNLEVLRRSKEVVR
jgi:K+-transporting ATPase ATPase C chain